MARGAACARSMMGKVRLEVLEGAENGPYGNLYGQMTPGEPSYILARIVNIDDRPLRQLWAEGDKLSPIHVSVKSGKDSGVWRDNLFVGDLDPGESRVLYIRAFVALYSSDGPACMTLHVRERWQA